MWEVVVLVEEKSVGLGPTLGTTLFLASGVNDKERLVVGVDFVRGQSGTTNLDGRAANGGNHNFYIPRSGA